jgi:type VI protein secretion system component Hcp
MKSMMTTSLVPLFGALVAFASPCMAQSRTTVTFSDGLACSSSASGPPVFVASSIAVKASVTRLTGSSGQEPRSGPTVFDDVAVTKAVDDCSVSMYNLLFRNTRVRSVVISFQNYTFLGWREALRITLANTLLSSVADTDAVNAAPSERVSFSFDSITIFDPVTSKTTMCDVRTNVCS